MAPKIPEQGRNAGSLVFTVRTVLCNIRISSGGTACQRGRPVTTMWSVPTTRLSGVAKDSPTPENNDEMEMVEQPFAASEIGESMDADLLPEFSGETWVVSALTEEFTADLPAGSTIDLIAESHSDKTLTVIRGWIQSNPLRHGQTAPDCRRNCVAGGYR